MSRWPALAVYERCGRCGVSIAKTSATRGGKHKSSSQPTLASRQFAAEAKHVLAKDRQIAGLKKQLDEAAKEKGDFKKKVEALESRLGKTPSDISAKPVVGSAGEAGTEVVFVDARIKKAFATIKWLREMPESIRNDECSVDGGYDARLQRAEQERRDAQAAKRGCKSLQDQMESSEHHVQRVLESCEASKTKLGTLQKKMADVAEEIRKQQDAMAKLDSD